MYLKLLRLSGFKSFVDNVELELTPGVNAIVGPNGCGKSNVIDAVRWVLGESSARNLRIDQMAGAIFAGSAQRPAYSQASIELVFDNASGRLGGEYARYAEVSLRRRISRDGSSDYYLNNTLCRRRDIQDLLYGTGLVGQGSYAIIEQGTINRFIEARPEQLRAILEEAAGVSRYKERRRETLRRLEHSAENLLQVDDKLRELEARLADLSAQARQAQAFRELQTRVRQLEAESVYLRLAELDQQLAKCGQQAEATQARLEQRRQRGESLNAQLADAEVDLAHSQQLYARANQERLDLTRLVSDKNGELRLLREQLSSIAEARTQLERARAEIASLLTQDQLQHEQASADWARLQPELSSLEEQLQGLQAELSAASAGLERGQQAWQSWQAEHNRLQSASAIARNKVEGLEQRIAELHERRRALEQQPESFDRATAEHQLEQLRQGLASSAEQEQQQSSEQQALAAQLQQVAAQLQEQQQQLAAEDERERQLESACAAARAVLTHLEQKQPELEAWLREYGVDPDFSVDQELSIASGWELALETVLGVFLRARKGANLRALASASPPAPVALLDSQPQPQALPNSLAACVLSGDYPDFLHNVSVAEDIEAAWRLRDQLSPGASVVTRDGVWFGANWLLLSPRAEQDQSLIEQRRRLQVSSEQLQELQQRRRQLRARRQELQEQHEQLQARQADQQRQSQQHQLAEQRQRHELERLQERIAAAAAESARRAAEASALHEQLQTRQNQHDEHKQSWSSALEQLEAQQLGRAAAEAELQQAREQHQRAQARERELGERFNQLRLQAREAQLQQNALAANVERAQQQLATNAERHEQLTARSETLAQQLPELEAELERLAAQQLQLQQQDSSLNLQLEQRQQQVAQLRAASNDARLAEQKSLSELEKVEQARASLSQQRQELGAQHADLDLDAIAARVATGMSPSARLQTLQKLRAQLEQFGDVNLLAENQHQQVAEQRQRLQQQAEELAEAKAILERAIAKIDSESRNALQSTLTAVNANLQKQFARIFTGGHATLSAQPGDLLDAGLLLFAQPPGKKIAQLTALSGGEKALTAMALIFAIFDLNPAPFCLLDEVDAPLDEHNTARFVDLIADFAQRSQFVVVTHNRITMEKADKLLGVTMNEPGVSRVVSVAFEDLQL